jgi:predicted PurR-regulated permease PerM
MEGKLSAAPEWTPGTKRAILIICLILIALAIWQFSVILAPLVVAVIIAFLLNPLVNWFTARTPLSRGVSAALIYIAFLLILALIPTLGAPLIIQQVRQLDFDVRELNDQLNEAMDYPLSLGGVAVNMAALVEPITGSLDTIFSPVATWAANVAVGIAGGFIWAIFIFVVGFYLLLDADRFSNWLDSWIPPAYEDEFNQLRHEIDTVWKAYFIGQLTLAIVVGIIISIATALLGIRSALILGVVAALLELIPNWGYGISGIVGVAFAYFQGSTYLPLPPLIFALLVAGFYFVMWQVDTNYLVPRIIGHRLQLPPALIIVGIIAGASAGGALGLLLAAPTIATIRVLGGYLYRRLLDLEPYVVVKGPPPIIKNKESPDGSQPTPSKQPVSDGDRAGKFEDKEHSY